MELDDDHPFAAGAIADDDVAQETRLLAEVEERQTVVYGVVADVVTYLVLQVVHQPAFLDGQNLIEGTSDMETNGWHVLQTLALVVRQIADLFFGQITFVGASEIELVAVFSRFHTSQDGTELRQFYLSDTRQLVFHLLLLRLQLSLVGQVLPLTASADTEMLAEGRLTYLTIFYESHHFAFGKGVLLTSNLYVADVARNTKGNEDHQVVPMQQTFALSGNSLNFYPF